MNNISQAKNILSSCKQDPNPINWQQKWMQKADEWEEQSKIRCNPACQFDVDVNLINYILTRDRDTEWKSMKRMKKNRFFLAHVLYMYMCIQTISKW